MKVTINRKELKKVLDSMPNIKTTLSILNNVLVEAAGNKLKITSTDLELAVIGKIEAEVEIFGKTTMPKRQLQNTVKIVQTDTITLELENDKIKIGNAKLNTEKVEDFPHIPDMTGETIIIPENVLKDITKTSVPFMSVNELRASLTGLYVKIKGNTIRTCATNGHFLKVYNEIEIQNVSKVDTNIIIQPDTVKLLAKLLSKNKDNVHITFAKDHTSFTFQNITLISNNIEGKYPDYQRVIPDEKDNNNKLVIDSKYLLENINLVKQYANPVTQQIKLSLNNKIELSASDIDKGEIAQPLTGEYTGDIMQVGFSAAYLTIILKSIDSDIIDILFNKPVDPVLFTSDFGYQTINLLMPIKLRE